MVSILPRAFPRSCKPRMAAPASMVLGTRYSMPARRFCAFKGRKISNWWANLETLWAGIGDSLFGFRVYPIGQLDRGHAHDNRGCAASTSTSRRSCDCAGAACSPVNLPARGALLQPRRGRRFAFQLLARQRPADLDALSIVLRIHFPFAAADCAAPALTASSGRFARAVLRENTELHASGRLR